ncbi:MAG: LCP family protein [Clostridia bacterium]|nr:LCP family protein [Clostridia bacterium]
MAGKHSESSRDTKRRIESNNQTRRPQKKRKSKKNVLLKIILMILLIIIIIIAGIVAGGYSYIVSKLNKMQQVQINVEELNVNEEIKGYRNIALFGVDSRNSNLGKGNRSDCIIIASINEKTKDVRLLSVYRDTYVQIEGHGLDKITHAYSYGEAPLAIKTLNTNLDLNITEFVTVNFDLVAEAVDALGGVEITIENSELQYINGYIQGTSESTGIKSSNITKAGKQTLDGVQAVAYSRIRYTAGGDYKRAERMRDVLEAMIKKLKTKSIGEINSLMDKILPKVYTNISSSSIIAMVPDLLKYNVTESIGWPYDTKGITLDRWYGVPVTLESNVKQLHKELFDETDYEVPSDIKEISNKIVNKTGYRE